MLTKQAPRGEIAVTLVGSFWVTLVIYHGVGLGHQLALHYRDETDPASSERLLSYRPTDKGIPVSA